MKVAIALVLLALLTLFAFWLVWVNRASEKILTTVIPIAVAALAGVFLAVFVFGGEPPIRVVFPVSFQCRVENKMPVSLPWLLMDRRFMDSLFAPAELYKVHPEFFNDPSDPLGATLYHHLLQRAIIDWMGMYYRATWQVEMLQFELPFGREGRIQPTEGSLATSKMLSTDEIEKLLTGNKFAGVHVLVPPQIALPPNTELRITPPQSKQGALENGEILLKNEFCTVSIETQNSSWLSGIGAYKELAGITDEEDKKLATANYIVRIKVQFNRLRSGHPKMALYKAWATQLSDGLRQQFDEQVIWAKTKEDFVFRKQIQQFGPAK